jgi:hypothetical protein
MNNTHRTHRPLNSALLHRPQRPSRPPGSPAFIHLRASLEGLDVHDSSFDDWLAAGGDRRTAPRLARPPADALLPPSH